ncbi:hypothetical protein C4N20_15765 [Fusobacterium ulcerans]|uniref:Uncharacterized protein n=1 Tax=Fusobacterium ulcerans TaxID=861 RepID=A0AAX2JCY4_9FUSO|nr:hypothetical protein [Fusobacterium ulcerans]AVQ29488.1 hypothetical protein C4N20_15765 [Fusobacterium ulcerans]EFS27011.1 hypothetical protein FUAG_02526 [Fusobacterium ulcerans ATCC 49185]SQJ03971.1 Uncharacterised protein [Fusobacterium ulcerans]
MEVINIAYVDDIIERAISGFLDEYDYNIKPVEIRSYEIKFTKEDDYKTLLKKLTDKNINLLVIDSALFLLDDQRDKRFTGEEFKIILKRLFPYIETIVISQNEQKDSYDIIKKYNCDKNLSQDPEEYYSEILGKCIDKKINEILMGREIFKKLDEKKEVDSELLEKISLSLDGGDEYSELKSEDIKELIEEFKKLKRAIDG